MVTPVLQTDIAIIGGGVAGLWALNLLRQRGYSTLLFEHDALGLSLIHISEPTRQVLVSRMPSSA